MKNNSKRICALLLAIVMCFTCVVPVFAETADHEHSDAEIGNTDSSNTESSTEETYEDIVGLDCPGLGEDGKPQKHTIDNTLRFVKVVKPTCGSIGYVLYECPDCFEPVITRIDDSLTGGTHEWIADETKESTEPTCVEPGYDYVVCKFCGEPDVKENAPALGHDATAPAYNCIDGRPAMDIPCTRCGEVVKFEEVPAGTKCKFELVSLVEGEEPTCTTPGKAYVKCTNETCERSVPFIVDVTCKAIAHNWVADVIDSKPTCIAPGSGIAKCTNCGETAPVVDGRIEAPVTFGTENVGQLGEEVKDFFAPHTFETLIPKTEPTCGEYGYEAHYKCAVEGCDAVAGEDKVECEITDIQIEKLPHAEEDWGDVVPAKKATCNVPGWKAYQKCSKCGAYRDAVTLEEGDWSKIEVIEEHNFNIKVGEDGKLLRDENGDYITNGVGEPIDPTCTEFGFRFFVCTKCGFWPSFEDGKDYVNSELPADEEGFVAPGVYRIPADGHTEIETIVPATCGKPGAKIYTCAMGCDYENIVEIPALEHVWVDKEEPGTCTKVGRTYKACELCNVELENSSVPTGTDENNHNKDTFKAENTTEPTCTDWGVKFGYCPDCKRYGTWDLEPLGHNFVNPVTTQPTCTADGYVTYTCDFVDHDGKVCGETKVEKPDELKTNGHVYGDKFITVAPSCEAKGYDLYTCTVCGNEDKRNETEKIPHTLVEGKVDMPTCIGGVNLSGNNGVQYYDCSVCGKVNIAKDTIYFDWHNKDHHRAPIFNPNSLHKDKDYVIFAGDCMNAMYVDYFCTACNKDFHHIDDSMVGKHELSTDEKDIFSVYKAPTCLEAGTYFGSVCVKCNNKVVETIVDGEKVYEIGENVDVEALGHSFEVLGENKTPDCENKGSVVYYYCAECKMYSLSDAKNGTDLFTEDEIDSKTILDYKHKFDEGEKVPYSPASCKAAGNYEYSVCECGKIEYVKDGVKILTDDIADVEIAALPHDSAEMAGVAHDCITAGYKIGYCAICKEVAVSEYEYAFGHKLVKVEEKLPDCVNAGNKEYYECSECGKLFLSDDVFSAENVDYDKDIKIDSTGDHRNKDGVEISCKNDDILLTAEDKICTGCGVVSDDDYHNYVVREVEASCTEYGYDIKFCIDCKIENVEKKEEWKPINPDHDKEDESLYVYETKKEATVFEDGEKVKKCAYCGKVLETIVIPALSGIEFDYEIDNAIYSGASYVNGGKIKLTIKYRAVDASLANVMIRLNYDSTLLTYDNTINGNDGGFRCDAVDETGNKIFATSKINGNDSVAEGMGSVVIMASTVEFGEVPVDKTISSVITDENGGYNEFAVIYFNINRDVKADTKIDFDVVLEGDSACAVRNAKNEEISSAETFGSVDSITTKALADINVNGVYNSADEVDLLLIAVAKDLDADGNEIPKYVAEADINQDGMIFQDDYFILQDLLSTKITYEELCAYAQADVSVE